MTKLILLLLYGDLKRIIIITIPSNQFFGSLSSQTLALALVTPWNTDGEVALKENIYMTTCKASIITDIRRLKAVIGLVETHGRWGVIDHIPSGGTEIFRGEGDLENTLSDDNYDM
ncbi:hypothetical protein J3R82DRAFT_6238 [Butyriboletus roseoflavus]|nr:hypothetical protein J3R82DRAFT_6238 [Butyriboletus roseoflavus]